MKLTLCHLWLTFLIHFGYLLSQLTLGAPILHHQVKTLAYIKAYQSYLRTLFDQFIPVLFLFHKFHHINQLNLKNKFNFLMIRNDCFYFDDYHQTFFQSHQNYTKTEEIMIKKVVNYRLREDEAILYTHNSIMTQKS